MCQSTSAPCSDTTSEWSIVAKLRAGSMQVLVNSERFCLFSPSTPSVLDGMPQATDLATRGTSASPTQEVASRRNPRSIPGGSRFQLVGTTLPFDRASHTLQGGALACGQRAECAVQRGSVVGVKLSCQNWISFQTCHTLSSYQN